MEDRELLYGGHRDDWKNLDERPHSNPGNFITLLKFRIEAGYKVVADHLTIYRNPPALKILSSQN